MTDTPTFADMRVEVCGNEVRLVFIASSPEHAQRIARDVAGKIKAERRGDAIGMEITAWPIKPARKKI